MRYTRPLLMLLRALVAVQIVIGLGFWLGYWPGLVNLHVALGSAYVFVSWMLAAVAIAQRRATGLAVGAIVLGAAIGAFGIVQRQLLVGDLHWIIRLVHLLLSVSAMPIAERLARIETAV